MDLVGHTAIIPASQPHEWAGGGSRITRLELNLLDPYALHFEVGDTKFVVSRESLQQLLNTYDRYQTGRED
jgi:hypothetical protein